MRRFCTVPRGRRASPSGPPYGVHHQPLPPPEWIEPYTDLADPSPYTAASAEPPTPSPWLPRVVSLVLRAPPATLAADLRAFCSTFLLRLSPAFVSAALRPATQLCTPLPRSPCSSSTGDGRCAWLPTKVREPKSMYSLSLYYLHGFDSAVNR